MIKVDCGVSDKKREIGFPKLMEWLRDGSPSGLVVLMTGIGDMSADYKSHLGVGLCLKVGNTDNRIGDNSCIWKLIEFVDYDDEVTIVNEK